MVTYTSLIATHQARLRCLLHKYILNSTDDELRNNDFYDDDDKLDVKGVNLNSQYQFVKDARAKKRNEHYTRLSLTERESETDRESSASPLESSSARSSFDSDTMEYYTPRSSLTGGVCLGRFCPSFSKKTKGPIINRFMNTSVVKMEINDKIISVSLIYNGEVDEEKPDYIYYVKPGTKDSKAEQGRYKVEEFHTKIVKNNYFKDISKDTTYTFYLIRHGQGEHNILKGKEKMRAPLDAHLTSPLDDANQKKEVCNDRSYDQTCGVSNDGGVCQGQRAGEAIRKSEGNVKIDFLFASDLQRTRETIINVIKTLDPSSNGKLVNKDIIILPCSHELQYTKKNVCDGDQGLLGRFTKENISSYDPNSIDPKCHYNLLNGIKINWTYYTDFYNGRRSKRGKESKKCRDTNMLQLAIDYIKKSVGVNMSREVNNSGGGVTRKRRSSKKAKKKQSKRVVRRTKHRRPFLSRSKTRKSNRKSKRRKS